MEVHHHPDLHHKKKNFKEYFLEFLMIFLAVFLGFIAENIREKLSDRSKGKEYVISIKKDLIADTSAINDFIPLLFFRINQFDSLIWVLQQPEPVSNGGGLYYLARSSTRVRMFEPTNTTITELEHSGNLRLITNRKVIDGLIKFQKIIASYEALMPVDIHEADLSYPLIGNLFDASVFNTMVKTGGEDFSLDTSASIFSNLIKPTGNPQLRNHDPDKINLLIFYLHERKSTFIGEAGILQEQKKSAASLIQIINREYRLNNQ
ncbi:MAG TPA: hypothetical protein VN726_00800 [Hanamia sp.]|nr:hypothetical protein [Hanamia sp.]